MCLRKWVQREKGDGENRRGEELISILMKEIGRINL